MIKKHKQSDNSNIAEGVVSATYNDMNDNDDNNNANRNNNCNNANNNDNNKPHATQ